MLDEIILNPELMQAERLHPNEKAQVMISENLWRALEPLLEVGLNKEQSAMQGRSQMEKK